MVVSRIMYGSRSVISRPQPSPWCGVVRVRVRARGRVRVRVRVRVGVRVRVRVMGRVRVRVRVSSAEVLLPGARSVQGRYPSWKRPR